VRRAREASRRFRLRSARASTRRITKNKFRNLKLMTTLAIFLQSGAGGFIVNFLPIFLIFAVFYFLLIVPQRKRQKELQETISNLKAGDRIVTTGGIIGTITSVRETSLLLRSADKSIIEVARSAVAGLQAEEKK
jgi:preprotein translocase subunit YajC